MSDLNKDIDTYNSMRVKLESELNGKWILIHNQKLIANYDSFEKAAEDAVSKFGKGPYLIRQVGAPPIVMPASVAYIVNRHA